MSFQFSTGVRLPEVSRGDRQTQVGSKYHFTGGVVLGDGPGVRFCLESNGEANCALVAFYRKETAKMTEQVLFHWFDEFGKAKKHYIDFVVVLKNQKTIGYAVRPTSGVSPEYLIMLSRIKAQAIEKGFLDDFRLVSETDICPIELFNANLFHSVRRPDCFADPVIQEIVSDLKGVTTVGALVALSGLEGMGFRAVVRLIGSGRLEQLNYERITYDSILYKTGCIPNGTLTKTKPKLCFDKEGSPTGAQPLG